MSGRTGYNGAPGSRDGRSQGRQGGVSDETRVFRGGIPQSYGGNGGAADEYWDDALSYDSGYGTDYGQPGGNAYGQAGQYGYDPYSGQGGQNGYGQYSQNGQYGQYGYDPYDEPEQAGGDSGQWYQNAGEQSAGGGYYEAYRRPKGPSMAERAAGKNADPYARTAASRASGGSRQRSSSRQQRAAAYDYERPAPSPKSPKSQTSRKRRKKRHPFRNFIVFLLLLAAILCGGYFLLFRAPAQTENYLHSRKADFYNILVCATDEDGTRTDTIMMLTLDQAGRTVSLTSIPRDTLLESGEKLNSVYVEYGCGESGAEAMVDQLQSMLGFRADGYMIISYEVFRDAVDALGGVTFDVPVDMTVDYANDPDNVRFIPAGEQLLDGDAALRVCRYRSYVMGDIQRAYVQQSFIKAMIRQCMSPMNWIRLPAVYQAVMRNLQTDLSGSNIRYVALWALLSYSNGINQNTLPGEGVTYWDASCYGLYGQSVVDMVNFVMNPYKEDITIEESDVYTVSEGYVVKSYASGVAFDASTYNYYE